MKYLSLAFSLLLISSAHASTTTQDDELFDCNFAADTAEQWSANKQSGMTLEQMRAMTDKIPSSAAKSIYVYYSEFGFKFDDKAQAHQLAYQSCQQSTS